MKKINKYLIGGAAGACLACIACGAHVFRKFGGLKIEPDELYFSDDEVKSIKEASRNCNCCDKEAEKKQDKCDCKKEKEPCSREKCGEQHKDSKSGIRNIFCKVFPDNKKYCNAIDDIIDVAYSNLESKERNRLLIALRDMLYEACDELIPDKDKDEDDETAGYKFVNFDGERFFDEEGNILPIDDLLDCEAPLAINLDKVLETDGMDGAIDKILKVLIGE